MKKNKKILILSTFMILILIIGILGYLLYKKYNEVELASKNLYNNNFNELTNYVQNVETYLAKSTISIDNKHSAETLTYLWREANLAQTYLASLPIESQELEKTEKFLNQVSDYSYTLSRKNIKGEDLSEEDLNNLEELHDYSLELKQVLNQLSEDLEKGNMTWKDLTNNNQDSFSQAVSSNLDIFSSLEEDFHEYSGLIYDGAFSEHLTSEDPKGLTGNDISEEDAKNKIKEVFQDDIKDLSSLGENENSELPSYNFSFKNQKDENITIAITKKGGHIVYFNCNRDIEKENLSYDDANKKGLEFLNKLGINNMKETYYLNENGIITINYAYVQNNIIMYPDLIKVKIALDDGEILGIETKGYLNNHLEREISKDIISKEDAKKKLNKNLNIQSEGLAIIPTEYKTEILCYEFKGKINDNEFIVYINAKTRRRGRYFNCI